MNGSVNHKSLEAELLELRESLRRKTSILNLVKDALEDMRLDLKYLRFDRDCLARERAALIEENRLLREQQ